jgi:hypothetical protein
MDSVHRGLRASGSGGESPTSGEHESGWAALTGSVDEPPGGQPTGFPS